MERIVLHVDLDQFIVAVELLRRPDLRGRPVLVGGVGDPTRRGVVAGASYEAREHGVRSGTPLRTAAARCPDAVFLPVDREAYEEASAEFVDVLRTGGGTVEVAGWDEAFLLLDTADARQSALLVQAAVKDRTGLACSVGIGDNKLRAKLASGFAKPAGVFRLDTDNWWDVVGERPPEALWGIGKKTAGYLAELGIATVRELAGADPAALAARFGPNTGPWLVALARGWDPTPVTDEPYLARSHGREETFEHNLTDPALVREEVRRIAHRVAADLSAEDELARRVVVKVRHAPFTTHTHGRALESPSREPDVLAAAALLAVEDFDLDRPIRLLGVRAEIR